MTKSRQAGQPAFRACSACGGDYEDPDRLPWLPGPDEEDSGKEDSAEAGCEDREPWSVWQDGDEFPADGAATAGEEAANAEERKGK
jgi:hypothetical protein